MSVTVFRTFVRSEVLVGSEKFTSLKPALAKLRKHQTDSGLERLELCVVEVSDNTWKREQDAKAAAAKKSRA